MKNNLFENLKKESFYALESKCRDIVFETFGSAKMAFMLGAISHDQFKEIMHMLISEGINNPQWRQEEERIHGNNSTRSSGGHQ